MAREMETGGSQLMDVSERMKLVRIVEQMNENKDFSGKLGIRDVSTFKKPGQKKNVI